MSNGSAEGAFFDAEGVDRAVILLDRAFRNPEESISRINVAAALAQARSGQPHGVLGGASVASSAAGREALRLVSQAWQILEQARLVCRDLSQPTGDWWVLTDAGRSSRDADDPAGDIRTRLPETGD